MDKFEIDIKDILEEFHQHISSSERIILSARFGDGKTFMLNKFKKVYKDKYYFITLHPVNYVVSNNKDIVDYIKRDILFQIIDDDQHVAKKEKYDAAFDGLKCKSSLCAVADFLESFPIEKETGVFKCIRKGIEAAITVRKNIKKEINKESEYLESFTSCRGSIYELDGFTEIIQRDLQYKHGWGYETVLIIEDMDRLDPAHLFRILNIFAAHIDSPIYNKGKFKNKFGFDKVILVMDYDMTAHIFHHFYGEDADYKAYMNKFMNKCPFHFSISEYAQRLLVEKIRKECDIAHPKLLFSKMSGKKYYIMYEEISKQSVRRCCELFNLDISSCIKDIYKDVFPFSLKRSGLLKYIAFDYLLDDGKSSIASLFSTYVILVRSCPDAVALVMPFYFVKTGETIAYLKIAQKMYKYEVIDISLGKISSMIVTSWDTSHLIKIGNVMDVLKEKLQLFLNSFVGMIVSKFDDTDIDFSDINEVNYDNGVF